MTPEEFASWYERYERKVFSVCRRLLGDLELAADIAQDVWLEAWAKRARYRDEGYPLAYLCTLARSRSKDELRRRRRLAPHAGISPELPHPRAVEALALAELATDLAPLIAGLPTAAQRVALALALRGLSNDEAAVAMGVSTTAAYKALLHRARVALRALRDEADRATPSAPPSMPHQP